MPSSRPTSRSTRSAPERGTALIGSLSGLLVVLAFLLLAVDVLLGLHARSAVTAVAYEAARDVAVAGDEAIGVRSSAERRARRSLGAVGAEATFTWRIDADEVTLEVAGERPGALLDAVGLRTREFRRTVTVRRELVR